MVRPLLSWSKKEVGNPSHKGWYHVVYVRWFLKKLSTLSMAPPCLMAFSVAKDEIREGIPVTRLIMNLKPWNSISRSLCGDVGTLPSITQMSAIYIHDDDILATSSEDLRCFFYLFYLFGVPQAWVQFMGFGRQVPPSMVPEGGVTNGSFWRDVFCTWGILTVLK